MCGICGIALADPREQVEPDRLLRMRERLAHRGPDDAGSYIAGNIGLGHRRLSIIDLVHGHQPLANEDGSVVVVFNGEIYNYRELTAELERCGHRFRTRCDTEVLVHGYESEGLAFVRRLNGMFAFALYDVRQRRLVLARDHLGVKPLFFARTAEGLFFGSEIKAVLEGSRLTPKISTGALQEYLIFRYNAGSRSIFDDVVRLPAGHSAVWEDGKLRQEQYWEPPSGIVPMSSREAEATLDEHLLRAVERQLISDVPLGAFCSGGVDSGLVTRFAARLRGRGLNTFAVGFDDPAWDESSLAADTAGRCAADHRTITATAHELAGLLPKLIEVNDEPLSHPNAAPLFVLSGLARRHVTVVLTGEGADELFGGYPRYHVAHARHALGFLPQFVRRGLGRVAGWLPDHRWRKLGAQLPMDQEDAVIFNSAYVAPQLVAALTREPVDAALSERRALVDRLAVRNDAVATMIRYELCTYLGCALERMDRMSMAHGLEARVPFLDLELVEWALTVPTWLKVGNGKNKRIVKRVAEHWLAPRITGGRKSGFGLPLDAWFRSPAFAGYVGLLRGQGHAAARHFNQPLLQRVLRQHLAGEGDHGELLWLVTNVYLWYGAQVAAHTGGAHVAAVS